MAALRVQDLQDRRTLSQRRVEELVVLFLKGDPLQPLQGQQSEASLHHRRATTQHKTTTHNTRPQDSNTTTQHRHTATRHWSKQTTSVVLLPLSYDHQVAIGGGQVDLK